MFFSKRKNIFHFFLILILLFIFIIISAISYTNVVSNNISNSVFRLHVLANSNSKEDQSLKLKVRDALLEYMNKISINCTSKNDIINIALQNKNSFKNIAENTVRENGFNYSVDVDVCTSYFPTKTYGDLSFPTGLYDCLKIKIGKADGNNWWCVMFPPLCFVDITTGIVPDSSKQQIKKELSDEEFELISSHNDQINFKFKIVELFQGLKLGKN